MQQPKKITPPEAKPVTLKVTAKQAEDKHVIWTSVSTGQSYDIHKPLEAVLGAYVACTTTTAEVFAQKAGIELNNIVFPKVEADYDFRAYYGDTSIPNRFQEVRYECIVETNASQEEISKLQLTVEKACPFHLMLQAAGVKFSGEWKKKI